MDIKAKVHSSSCSTSTLFSLFFFPSKVISRTGATWYGTWHTACSYNSGELGCYLPQVNYSDKSHLLLPQSPLGQGYFRVILFVTALPTETQCSDFKDSCASSFLYFILLWCKKASFASLYSFQLPKRDSFQSVLLSLFHVFRCIGYRWTFSLSSIGEALLLQSALF